MNAIKVAMMIAISGVATSVYAQDPPADDAQHSVTWEQYQAAIRRIEALEKANTQQYEEPVDEPDEDSEQIEELTDRVDTLEGLADDLRIGTSDFLVTGFASTTYTSKRSNSSSFNAAFNPIFLWKLSDRISFAGELEYELAPSGTTITGSSDGTAVNLEFMDVSFVVNDYLTIRGGKILTPLSTFKEHLHPTWINKLPDQPLFAGGGARLIPTSSLAFEARGAFPVGDSRVFYSAYVSNGPKLVTTGGKIGQLNFSNFSDVNSNKGFGGRIGIFPIPELDVSYAFMYADVGADGTAFKNTNALIQDISLGYVTEKSSISGRLELRAEYIDSEVDDVAYGANVFNNSRSGGYFQASYRPTLSDGFFKDVEGVVRYDWLDNPATGVVVGSKAYDEQRITLGLNYWFTPSAVFKVAYQFDNVDDPTSVKKDDNAFMVQMSMGF